MTGPIKTSGAPPGGKPKKKRKIRLVRTKRQPLVAGWREWASLPDLGVSFIKVKLDTGARTSALHAWKIKPFERDGEDWVRFDLYPVQRNKAVRIACEAPLVGQRIVRSTSGNTEKRYVIRTPLMLGGQERVIEVTLTNRDHMGFRMLLGRTAMRGRIIVDPARSYLHPAVSSNMPVSGAPETGAPS